MGWRLIVYCTLAIALTVSFLFITIENESLSSEKNNSSIFNAKEIEIRSSSKNKLTYVQKDLMKVVKSKKIKILNI